MLVDKIINLGELILNSIYNEKAFDSLKEDERANAKDKANALIFMRRHLHDSFKV